MKACLFLPILLFLCCFSFVFASGDKENSSESEVVVYAYDSFLSEWGPGPEIEALFEAETGYELTMISCGDAAQVLSRIVLEKDKPYADVAIGIDNQLYENAAKQDVFMPYKPANFDEIVPAELALGLENLLTPFDWSYFALIFDSESGLEAPKSLSDLTNPIYNKKIILMDPRTSTPGLGFVTWTLAVFGDKYLDFWKALKPNILTMAPGWDAGYGLFTSGEAPLVISYTTSAAYHVEYDGTDRYEALIFEQGHPVQVEGAGILKNAPNKKGAEAFIDFLISQKAQNALPLTQWMYPINENVILPASYNSAPKAETVLSVDNALISDAVENIMNLLSE